LEVDAYNASPLAKVPLYDGHGNMIATLTKGSGGTCQVSARRYADPWGVTRVGASTGPPDQRYCANLGHRQDDESGLTYMRARYYEPTTGRFISEDPARDGANWFGYASNDPIGNVDPGGHSAESVRLQTIGGYLKLIGMFLLTGGIALDFACFPSGIKNLFDLGNEYRAVMEVVRHLDTGTKVTKWQKFADASRFLVDAFLYKKQFNGFRGVVGGALVALLGYQLVLYGELLQTEAAFIGD
jgi:RHS repeat-associated protein